MDFKYLCITSELLEKAMACKTPEEAVRLTKEEDYELSDEQIESIAGGDQGGDGSRATPCPGSRCRAGKRMA